MKINQWIFKHKDLVLLAVLPVAITVVMAMLFILPTVNKRPTYDFIYVKCASYCSSYGYSVSESKIYLGPSEGDSTIGSYKSSKPDLAYYYDIDTETSIFVSEDQYGAFELSTEDKAPDGFELVYGDQNKIIGTNNYHSWDERYLANGAARVKVEVYEGSGDIRFIGWVINDGR